MKQKQPARVGRRLAAIVAADVAGYSRLMGLDEVGTARTLREHRKVTDALVAKHGGRLVKTTGDGVLLEFPSVVDAVECAVAVQAVMAQRNEGVPQDRRMLFRIGINLGDILIEGDDILGDGVNVAARLEGIAEPGGICISSSAYEQVRGKVSVEFTDLGEQILKNIARPIRAYAVGLSAKAHQAAPLPSSAPHLSIVVLPFANIGGDPEQEYFVDGVTESLTTDLSRISGAFVIARNTAFTFKGKPVDVKKLGRELNVRYVLEGSVQRGGNRLRVNVQLIDAETGNHLWAERFDKPVADLFDMQDEIVSRLANALDAELIAAEARRAERSPHPDAMDLVFQGSSWFNKGLTPDNMARARSFFEKAIALDPENIEAMVGLARVDALPGASFMTDDWSARLAAAETTLTKGIVPRTEPRFGSRDFGLRANIYETRSPRHRGMRAGVGAGSQFSPRSCSHRVCEVLPWSRRRNRGSHQRGLPPFSSRHLCRSLDGVCRPCQGAARCRCRSGHLDASGPRRKPKLFVRAFPSRSRAGAAWRARRGARHGTSGTCARSKLHHPSVPRSCTERQSDFSCWPRTPR